MNWQDHIVATPDTLHGGRVFAALEFLFPWSSTTWLPA